MGVRVSNNDASTEVSRAKPRVGVVSVNLVVDQTAVLAAASVASAQPVVAEYHVTPVTRIAYVDLLAGVFVDYDGFYKLLAESFTVADVISLTTGKTNTDAVLTADSKVFVVTKPQTDAVSTADVFSRIVGYSRALTELTSTADSDVLNVGKVLAETFSSPDTNIFAHQKLLADGIAMNDGMEAQDGFGIALTRGISNVTMVADSRTLSFTGSRVESVAVQDSGSLRSQGYCDFSYFAEDYVGVALTF